MTNQTPIEEATGYLEARRYQNAILRQEDCAPIDTIHGKPLTARTVNALLEQIKLDEQRLTELRERYTSLRAAFDGVCGERDQLGRQLDAAEAQPADREQLLALIDALTDDSDCWFDHNGMCQGHGVPLDPGQRCPHAEAKELLAARPNPLESAVTEALSDIATDPADPEPAPPAPPWLVEAGDD